MGETVCPLLAGSWYCWRSAANESQERPMNEIAYGGSVTTASTESASMPRMTSMQSPV
jgi:hypothetical protein